MPPHGLAVGEQIGAHPAWRHRLIQRGEWPEAGQGDAVVDEVRGKRNPERPEESGQPALVPSV